MCSRRWKVQSHSAPKSGLQFNSGEKKEEGERELKRQWQLEIAWQGLYSTSYRGNYTKTFEAAICSVT